MKTSLTKKITLYVLSGVAVILTSFFIAVQMPGDVLDNLLLREEKVSVSSSDYEIKKSELAHRMGLEKPLFYFHCGSLAEIGYEIYLPSENQKNNYGCLLRKYGSGKHVYVFTKICKEAQSAIAKGGDKNILPSTKKTSDYLRYILTNSASANMDSIWAVMQHDPAITSFHPLVNLLQQSWKEVENHQQSYKKYIPAFAWSWDNRFSDWIFGGSLSAGLTHLDLGTSFFTGEKIAALLKDKIVWSLGFSISAILLAFIIGIPLACYVVYKNNKILNAVVNMLTAISYAMPTYLAGVFMLFLFSNPDVINILPSSGVKPLDGFEANSTLLVRIWSSLPYLILPLICYTYTLLAFVISTTKDLLQHQMQMPYILTARAKGMDEKSVVYRHALKNVLPSLAALLSNIFPAIIGGSVIIETLFSIPGMGNEIVRACISRNFPLLSAIILISGFATIIVYLIVDITLYRLDPRIKQSTA